MLVYNFGKYEVDSEMSSIYELEKVILVDEEVYWVVVVIGLLVRFDFMIKLYNFKGFNFC